MSTPSSAAPPRTGARNQTSTRARNRALVLNLIRIHQPVSRADLVTLTGLTKGTMSNIAGALIDDGLVAEVSPGRSGGGRPPTLLRLAAERIVVGAIHLRPRHTLLASATLDGTVLRRDILPTDRADPAGFLAACARSVAGLLEPYAALRVVGVGLTVPGTVSADRGRIVHACGLGWRDVDVEPAARLLPWPLILENDAAAAALAELFFGEARREGGLVRLTLDDGVGAGVIAGGALFRGADGTAGDAGHLVVEAGGESCPCGRPGTLAAYASGAAAVRRFRAAHLGAALSEEDARPVTSLTVTPGPRTVRLAWTDDARRPRRYDVYRSDAPPVPVDDAHRVASTVEPAWTDVPADERPYFYVVVAEDLFGRRSRPAETQVGRAAPPRVLLADRYPDAAVDRYRFDGTVFPRRTDAGLLCDRTGDSGASGQALTAADGDGRAFLWRGDYGDVVVTGRVQPLEGGEGDTLGVLVCVDGADRWHGAFLAASAGGDPATALCLVRRDGADERRLAELPMPVEPGRAYDVQVEACAGWVRARAWAVGTAVPDDWQLAVRADEAGGGAGLHWRGRHARLLGLRVEAHPRDGAGVAPPLPVPLEASGPLLELLRREARAGDPAARRALSETARYLGLGVVGLYAAYGIRRFRVSGCLAESWDLLDVPFHDALAEQGLAGGDLALDVRPSHLAGRDPVLAAVSAASLPLFDVEYTGW